MRTRVRRFGVLATVRTEFRVLLVSLRCRYLNLVWGTDIHPSAQISLQAHIDRTHPRGVHIGADTTVCRGAAILSHDMVKSLYAHTRIGRCCFVGMQAIILPGVTVGDHCIVGAGSVVTRDVPVGSIVAGNPARVIRSEIATARLGVLIDRNA